MDTFCYGPSTDGQALATSSGQVDGSSTGELIVIASGTWGSGEVHPLQDSIIKITSIDYDPYGTDAGNEKI